MLRKRVKEHGKGIHRLKRRKQLFGEACAFLPPTVESQQKLEHDISSIQNRRLQITEKIAFYYRMFGINRQNFYKYLASKDSLEVLRFAEAMKKSFNEGEYSGTHGWSHMQYQALLLKQPDKVRIPANKPHTGLWTILIQATSQIKSNII